ncbi:MAG: hypothetical protein HOP02_02205 [Methylococcaceae bacterium]|nr:hypothetical protein [Methylococcaceae bacterium]
MKATLSLFTLLISLWGIPAASQPLTPEQVPEPLKPWINWVLQGDTNHNCAFIYNQFEQKYCSWPGQLTLTLNNTQGSFSGFWQVDQESWVLLPGDEEYWPQQVTINKQPALVVAKDDLPALKLKPGRYDIQGQFNWDFIPEQLQIPDNTGLIKLTINNTPIVTPAIKEGLLWLKDSERGGAQAGKVSDKLDLQVFRKITDDVPLQVETHIELDVAGTAREVKLSQALLTGFTAMRLDSPLPARLEADGQLVVQVRPGHWQLKLLARQATLKDSITLPASSAWPTSEIWVLAAQPSLRVVEVVDLEAIDPSQTNLPADWQSLPAYRLKAGQAMNLKVMRRGNPDPEPNQLTLKRQLWLDFDGLGYTLNDQIGCTMTRDWRLNVLPETALGKVSLNEQSQLITRSATGEVGFEVRQGALNVQADSRYQGAIDDLSVTGWQQTFHQVNTVINLPPGWRLLAASGVDNVPDSWLARWTLLDIFMVLIAAFAVAHLWQFKWGLFALLALILIWHEADAPHFIWLNLLAAIALLRIVPSSKLLTLLDNYRKLCGLSLIIITIPFMVAQVRIGLHPQLEMPWQSMQAAVGNELASMVSASPAPAMTDALKKPIAKMRSTSKNEYAVAEVQSYNTANVQTGPGLPQWQWHKISLTWNGAVDSQQRVKLWFLSPLQTCLLNFLRVALVALLALLLFGGLQKFKPAPSGTLSAWLGLLLLPFLLIPSAPAKAEFPPQTVLDDLKTRLLTPPDCLPSCAQIAQAQINITPDLLQLKLQIDAEETVAIPLPAQQNQWLPEQVMVDGIAKAPLMRDAEGQLWLQVTKGRHQLIMQGKPPALDKFSLSLPLKPHRVTINQTGWEQSGVHEHGISDAQLQFTRVLKAVQTGTAAESTSLLPALFSIKRTLQLGLDWHVHTEVIRLTPADSAAFLAVPLLPGESVVSAGLRVDKQQVLLNIDAAQTQAGWESVLEKTPQLELTAPLSNQWAETWAVAVSPLWHLTSEGLAPVHPIQASDWQPEWRPYPGEKLRLLLTKPEAVSGQTLTVDHSQLSVSPGKRITENTLVLHLKSSKGGQHILTLPAAAHLQSVTIDGVTQPIQQQANTVTLPVKPGAQEWQLLWQQSQAVGLRFTTPEVNIGLASVNSHIKLTVGSDRWVLYTFGPRLGPAVLFWGFLLVMALLAVGLAKSGLTPLKYWQWFLLLLGLSQLPIESALLVVGWLCLLGLRGREALPKAATFNAVQILLVGLTLLAGLCLFSAVEKGLLGSPEMQISGNQSSATDLNWYQDRSAAQLPVAGIISVPLLAYRSLMLLWSLWLAVALLKWLKWGWQCFETGGLWRKLPPKKITPKPAAESNLP